jgi:hypothetical protein
MEQARQKRVKFNILKWGNKKIEEICHFTDAECKEIISKLKYKEADKKEFLNFNSEIVDMMIQFRDDFRDLQVKATFNNTTLLDEYFQPVNYNRIIFDAKNMVTNSDSVLDPLFVLAEIERLMDPRVCQIVCITDNDINTNSPKIYNQRKAKYLFQIALYEYLSPKRCLYEYKFNKQQFDQVILEIIKSYNNSMVEPGEMVGIVACQSLGEPLTQMSTSKETLIHLKNVKRIKKNKTIICDEQIKKVKIGEFIDMMMDKYPDLVQDIPNHLNSTETNISHLDEEYYRHLHHHHYHNYH